jgi:hypothetical protein
VLEPPDGVVFAEALLAGCSDSPPPADRTLPAAEAVAAAAAAAVRLSPPLTALEAHTRWAVNFRTHCGPLRRFLTNGDAGGDVAAVQLGGAPAGVLLKLDKAAGMCAVAFPILR